MATLSKEYETQSKPRLLGKLVTLENGTLAGCAVMVLMMLALMVGSGYWLWERIDVSSFSIPAPDIQHYIQSQALPECPTGQRLHWQRDENDNVIGGWCER